MIARENSRYLRLLLGVASITLVAFLLPAGARAATGSISGIARNATTENPLSGVQVCAYNEQVQFESKCDDTNLGGEYSILGLPPGEYLVWFNPGARIYAYGWIEEWYSGRLRWEEPDLVSVSSGQEVSGIDENVRQEGWLTGRVLSAANGSPVDGVWVCAVEVPEEEWLECRTSYHGSYEITGLPPHQYKVEFSTALLGANLLTQYYDHEMTWESADPVSVPSGGTLELSDAELEPGAEVTGVVQAAATGEPLPEIVVCAIEAGTGELWSCTETDSAGRYALLGLPAGEFKIGFSLELAPYLPEYSPEELPEPDQWPDRFYDGKATLAEADPLHLSTPEVLGGIDAALGAPKSSGPAAPGSQVSSSPASASGPAFISPQVTKSSCRRGYVKKRAKGKLRCTRRHRRHRSRHWGKPVAPTRHAVM